MKRNTLRIASICFVLIPFFVGVTPGEVERYTVTVDSDKSVIHTSGGITGEGMGDLSAAGSFQAMIVGDLIHFADVNFSTLPVDVAKLIIPDYDGHMTADRDFQGSKPYENRTGGGDFVGMFLGSSFHMNGNYDAPCCDQFNYEFSIHGQASRVGDFNVDGMLTDSDIDMLTRVIHTSDSWFDLNRDGQVENMDRQTLIIEMMNTFFGDANLDGEYSTRDLVVVFQGGKFETGLPASWVQGDFDGDGFFNSGDFVHVFANGSFEEGPRPGPGPGPSLGIREPTPGTFRWYGDLNLDETFTGADIDLLTTAMREQNDQAVREIFQQRGIDLDRNGQIDLEDRQVWIQDIKQTYCGDANLDGEFNSRDLIIVFQAGEYEDMMSTNSTWAEGDWNGDLEFDSGDFAHCFAGGGFEQGPRQEIQSVPEANHVLAVLTSILVTLRYRNRSKNADQLAGETISSNSIAGSPSQ